MSICLEPILHPPGIATFTSPNLERRGPATRIEARIFLTSSYGASKLFMLSGFISMLLPVLSRLTRAPRSSRTSAIVRTSSIIGTFFNIVFPFDIIEAAIIFNAEFFAPLTLTFPESLFPPLIIYFI